MVLDLAFIGCGYIAKRHVKNLLLEQRVNLKCFCDINYERALLFSKEFGGKPYKYYQEMLEKESLDGVFICTPPSIRIKPIRKCAEREINIFLEKPLALTCQEGKEIIDIVRKKKIILQVGFVYRFQDVTQQLKKSLENGELGRVSLIAGRFWSGVPGPEWWRDSLKSGGQLIDMSSHIFDLINYLFGPPSKVCGISSKGIHNNDYSFKVDDANVTIFKIHEDICGCVTNTCNSPYRELNYVDLQIVGSKGSAILKPRNSELEIFKLPDKIVNEIFICESPIIRTYQHEKNVGYVNEIMHFISCIINKTDSCVTSEMAFKTVCITFAIQESIRTGYWIKVDYNKY